MKFGFRLHPFDMFPDVPAIVDTAQRAARSGVTHLLVRFSTRYAEFRERIEAFSGAVIRTRRSN